MIDSLPGGGAGSIVFTARVQRVRGKLLWREVGCMYAVVRAGLGVAVAGFMGGRGVAVVVLNKLWCAEEVGERVDG